MADDEDEIHTVTEFSLSERFQDFHKIFFDPCTRQHIVISGVRFLTHSDSPFTKAAEKLQLRETAPETSDIPECVSPTAVGVTRTREDEIEISGISEGDVQPDVVRSSELLSSPVSPDIVPEMEEIFHNNQWSERRQSSAYGSQDHSLSTLGRNEDEDDRSLNRNDEEQGAVPVHSGGTTPDSVVSDDENTVMLPANSFPLSLASSYSLRMDFPTAELSDNSGAANVPSVVAGWQLTNNNEFELIRVLSAITTDGLEQDEIPPAENRQAVQQLMAYQELQVVVTELENRLIRGLLVALLQENCLPEFVRSVAEALILSASETAATGRFCLFPFSYH